jgi:hypothetical protein
MTKEQSGELEIIKWGFVEDIQQRFPVVKTWVYKV